MSGISIEQHKSPLVSSVATKLLNNYEVGGGLKLKDELDFVAICTFLEIMYRRITPRIT